MRSLGLEGENSTSSSIVINKLEGIDAIFVKFWSSKLSAQLSVGNARGRKVFAVGSVFQ